MIDDANLMARALAALANGEETAELRQQLKARLASHALFLDEDPRETDPLRIARDYMRGVITDEQAPEALRRLSLALVAQSGERYDESNPFLLRLAVRPDGPGPIQVLINGYWEVISGQGRACMIEKGVLMLPGMIAVKRPADLVLLGRALTPREAIEEWARANRGLQSLRYSFVEEPVADDMAVVGPEQTKPRTSE